MTADGDGDGGERNIVQIAATPGTEEHYETLYALCDDGTVWMMVFSGGSVQWRLLPDIPQPVDD